MNRQRRTGVERWARICISSALLAAGGCAKHVAPSASTDNPEHLYAKGAKAYQSGDHAAAVPALEAAVKANPKLIMARERLGDAYKDLARYDDAMVQYQMLTELDPYGPGSWYKLGVSQQMLNKLDAAAESYRKALRLDSRDWRSRMNLGLVLLSQGKMDEATAATKAATDAAPEEPDAWANHGAALDAAGKLAEAEAAYRKSLSLKADQPAVQLNLATNLLAQNKPADAVEPLRQVVQQEDSAMARKRLGDALAASDQTGDADTEYRTALQRDPSYYPALNALAAMKMKQFQATQEESKKAEAIDAWRQSLKINGNQPKVTAALEAAK